MGNIDAEFREMAEAAIKIVDKRMQVPKVAKPKYPHYKAICKRLINGGWKKYFWKNLYEGMIWRVWRNGA